MSYYSSEQIKRLLEKRDFYLSKAKKIQSRIERIVNKKGCSNPEDPPTSNAVV